MESVPSQAVARLPGRRRIPAVLWDAIVEARRHREEAVAACRAMRERSAAQVDAARTTAAAQGREEGLAGVTELMARAALAHDSALAAAERDIVDLAYAIASRVLARAVERDPASVVEIAARALSEARQRADVVLRAHPDDVAALRAAEPSLALQLVRTRRIVLVPDGAVERGGVVIDTEVGRIDARLATQLEGLRRAVEAGQ